MKKYIYIILGAAILAGCQKTEIAALTESGSAKGEGATVVFSGSAIQSKISVGDKVGNVYQGLWAAGDAIAVYKTDGTSLGNAELTSDPGQAAGTFALSTSPSLADGTSVRVLYPATASYAGENSIATEQSSSKDLAGRTLAYSTDALITSSTSVVGFKLWHAAALVKISVSSEEYAGASVDHVIFRSEGAAVSGSFTADPEAKTVTPATTEDYVKVSTSLTLSASAQEIWFTAIPSDLSGKEIDIAFHITKDGQSFYLPVGFKGKELKADVVNSFSISGLSESNCVSWYEPFDSRLMPGEGYAYGEANCFFIQCKNGSSYTGATYTPNASISDEVVISYKARGDFQKVSRPADVSFTWMRLGDTDSATGTGTGSVYVCRTANYSASNVDPTKFTFSQNAADYTVTVKNTGAYAGAPILLMVKNGKILWGWSFWNVAADGTDITPVAVKAGSSIKILPMDIGQATTQYETWIANKNGSKPDPVYRTIYRYQWGRALPVFWNPMATLNIPGTANNAGNIPAIVGPMTLAKSLEHPCGLIVASATETNKALTDWLTEPNGALWGNLNANANDIGDKSIYDPCPKGYRVADRNTLNTLRYGVTWKTASTPAGYPRYTASVTETDSIVFIKPGYYTEKTAMNSNIFAVSSMGGADTGLCIYGIWWSNLCQADANNPSVMANNNEATANPGVRDNLAADVKARGFSVRCQVDEDNR